MFKTHIFVIQISMNAIAAVNPIFTPCCKLYIYTSSVWLVQQMGPFTNACRCDGGSGGRKCAGREHRCKQVGSLCSSPSFLSLQHMGAKWGQRALHMLARSHRTSLPSHTYTNAQTHTHLTGSPVLAWRWGERRCQHQQMPCAPILEGPLLFLPPFEIHVFCVLLFSMFGLEMLCHFGRFYLSASVWVRGPGFGLKSLGDMGRRFNQPGVALWFQCFSLGFHFTVSLAALRWPVVLRVQHLPLNLFLTHSGDQMVP